jgi:hypothetical protein
MDKQKTASDRQTAASRAGMAVHIVLDMMEMEASAKGKSLNLGAVASLGAQFIEDASPFMEAFIATPNEDITPEDIATAQLCASGLKRITDLIG